jgi:hypothetical protein
LNTVDSSAEIIVHSPWPENGWLFENEALEIRLLAEQLALSTFVNISSVLFNQITQQNHFYLSN